MLRTVCVVLPNTLEREKRVVMYVQMLEIASCSSENVKFYSLRKMFGLLHRCLLICGCLSFNVFKEHLQNGKYLRCDRSDASNLREGACQLVQR